MLIDDRFSFVMKMDVDAHSGVLLLCISAGSNMLDVITATGCFFSIRRHFFLILFVLLCHCTIHNTKTHA